ncbi:hypothetical protein KAT95_00135 [Candidatus Parcubacteria bacterium]|nr:hypothetical protein [Candidatus Parcubacteria bacterium]
MSKIMNKCINCGGQECDVRKMPFILFALDDETNAVKMGEGDNVVAVICRDCGYIHLFSKKFLDEKLKTE